MHQITGKHGKITITPVYLAAFYDMPMKQAASLLGISGNTLKQICRRHGLSTWPCRELYTETHRDTNRRDVHAGRESLMLQMRCFLSAYPEDKEARLHFDILQSAKTYAARYNLYRGNAPIDVQDFQCLLPSSTLHTAKSNLKADTATTSIKRAKIVHTTATANTTDRTVQSTTATANTTDRSVQSTIVCANPTVQSTIVSAKPSAKPCANASEQSTAVAITPTTQEAAKPSLSKTDEMLAAIEGVRQRREERERELARLNFDAACWPSCDASSHHLLHAIKPDEDELLLGPVTDSQLFNFFL
jgi:hypothetical protein